jgi:hypothetical protein
MHTNTLGYTTVGRLLRHPELVSGAKVPLARVGWNATWMLNQVQHDDAADIALARQLLPPDTL